MFVIYEIEKQPTKSDNLYILIMAVKCNKIHTISTSVIGLDILCGRPQI